MIPCFLTLYVVQVGDGYQIRGRHVYEEVTGCYAMTHKHYPSKAQALSWAIRCAQPKTIRGSMRAFVSDRDIA